MFTLPRLIKSSILTGRKNYIYSCPGNKVCLNTSRNKSDVLIALQEIGLVVQLIPWQQENQPQMRSLFFYSFYSVKHSFYTLSQWRSAESFFPVFLIRARVVMDNSFGLESAD